jgi:hypothetical protein
METNMKRTLWTTAAAVALLAGSSVAFAEGGMGQGRDSQASPSQQQMNQAQPKADDKAMPRAAQDRKADDKAMPRAAQDKPAAAPKAAEDKGRAPSQTTGQGGSGQSQQPSGQTQRQPSGPSGAQAPEDRSRPQGQTGQRGDSQAQPSGQQQQRQPSAAQQSPSGSQQSPTTGLAGRPVGDSVTLTTEQKTKIRSTVLTSSAPRVTNINFAVSVGTVVPRTVKLVAVPAPLIEIHPEWRGYSYFVVNDEIIIVEPRTLKIVAVVAV